MAARRFRVVLRTNAVTAHPKHHPTAPAVAVIDVAEVLSRSVLPTGASLPSAPAQGGTTP
jgi:hypothetical protein